MSYFAHKLIRYCSISLLSLTSMAASASVVITGTRVIYPSEAKEVTVKINNVGAGPVLLQSWIDNGDVSAKPENINVPFIISPPINRIEPAKGQTLRISYTGAALPANKESVFWLNVLEIPAKGAQTPNSNYLQMAFRSRIKLFFRPAGLAGDANDAAKSLTWSASAAGITATNPTPYYVSLVSVTAKGKQVEGEMLAPGATQSFALAGVPAGNKVGFESVNDYGAIIQGESVLR